MPLIKYCADEELSLLSKQVKLNKSVQISEYVSHQGSSKTYLFRTVKRPQYVSTRDGILPAYSRICQILPAESDVETYLGTFERTVVRFTVPTKPSKITLLGFKVVNELIIDEFCRNLKKNFGRWNILRTFHRSKKIRFWTPLFPTMIFGIKIVI